MPELMLVLPGSIRSKKNSKSIVKAGGRWIIIPSTAYRKWEKQARKYAIEQGGNLKLTCDVHVKVSVFYKGQRPDLSGAGPNTPGQVLYSAPPPFRTPQLENAR